MNLVKDLLQSGSKDDVITVLRKAKHLAIKIKDIKMSEWIQQEQAGYRDLKKPVPIYRLLECAVFLKLPQGLLTINTKPMKAPVRIPLSEIVGELSTYEPGDTFLMEMHASEAKHLIAEIAPQYTGIAGIALRPSHGTYKSIPDQVKDLINDWASKLDCEGITGEDVVTTTQAPVAQTPLLIMIERAYGDINVKDIQISHQGDNTKIIGEASQVNYTKGDKNTTIVGSNNKVEQEGGLWGKLWEKIKGLFGF